MLIEVHGAGFFNKGANLMLSLAADELRRRIPGARICIEPGHDRPYPSKAALGLWTIFSLYPAGQYGPKFKPAWMVSNALARALPSKGLSNLGIVRREEIDALVDISGYSFGDKNGPWPSQRGAFLARHHQERGNPVVLLPQMFGPFEKPEVAQPARELITRANLVYARDPYSLTAVEKLVGPQDNVRLAPDLTLFTRPAGEQAPEPTKRVFIVANHQVYLKGAVVKGDEYITHLRRIYGLLGEAGYEARFLIHDGSGKDLSVVRQVLEDRDPADHTEQIEDPFALKKEIAKCAFIVASRFHAVAGALSQGVPSLTIGWGYKYEALHEDFGVPELCLSSTAKLDRIGETIAGMAAQRDRLSQTLIGHREKLRPAHEQMWQDVVDLLQRT